MARLSSDLVLTLTDKVSGPARGVGRSLDRLEDRTRGLGRMTAASSAAMGRAGSMLVTTGGALAGAGAALAVKETVRAAADFESALTEIQKKAGTSAAQTAKLGDEIKALATSGELAVSIADIASAYERGAAAGIPIADLKEFAALSVKAADGFGMSAEEVGNFAAKLKTALGQTNEDVRKTFDLTNSLADAGIADESAIVDFVDRTGASLKSLGLSMPQTLAVGASMLNLGMTSDVASTATDALARKMQLVGTLTGKSRKSFEKVMGPVKTFSKLVEKDANAALLTLLDRIKGLKGSERAAFLKDFIGDEHAGKVLRLADAVEEYRRNLALANDQAKWFGSLDASYKLKLDDFWSQWQLVKNSLESLAVDAGNMAMPGMKAALDGARGLIAEVDRGLKGFKATVDMSEIHQAMTALGELGGQISSIMQLGGDKTPIGAFFDRLATSANLVSNAMNIAHDALEAVGLATPDDDTPAQRQRRRDGVVDNLAELSPPMKGVRAVYDIATHRFDGETYAGFDAGQNRAIAQAAATRGVTIEQVRAEIEANARRRAARTGEPYRSPFNAPVLPKLEYPTAPPPDLARARGEKAVQDAQAIGRRIEDAFNITAAPAVNMSGVTGPVGAAIAQVDQLRRKLDALGPAAERASRRSVRDLTQHGAGNYMDGLHANIEN